MPKFKVSVVDEARKKELKSQELEASDGASAATELTGRPVQNARRGRLRATSARTDMPAGEVRDFYEQKKR